MDPWTGPGTLVWISPRSSHRLDRGRSHRLPVCEPRRPFQGCLVLPLNFSLLSFLSRKLLSYSAEFVLPASPALLRQTLSILAKQAERVVICDYALSATLPSAHAHVLAVLTEAALECRKPSSVSNVRTIVYSARCASGSPPRSAYCSKAKAWSF